MAKKEIIEVVLIKHMVTGHETTVQKKAWENPDQKYRGYKLVNPEDSDDWVEADLPEPKVQEVPAESEEAPVEEKPKKKGRTPKGNKEE